MKNTRAKFLGTLMAPALIRLGLVLALAVLTLAQDAREHHIVKDWTNHHVVFSNPGTAKEAMEKGTYDRWLKIVNDPRYIAQQWGRSAPRENALGFPAARRADDSTSVAAGRAETSESSEERFDLPPALARDGDAAQSSGGVERLGLMKALISPPAELVGTESDLASASPDAKKKPKNRMKKDWSETLGSTSGTAGGTGGSTGLGEFPATFSSGGTSCTDFAVYNTGLAGSSSQANIISYDNLYASCNSGVPTAYWAYNTGSLGGVSATIANSVVLSEDGTQVAFVQFVPYATAASGTETANTGVVPTAGTTITVGSVTYTWETTASITTVNQMSTSGITLETEISQTLYAALTGSRANCPSSNTTCISASQTANSAVTPTVSGEVVTVAASCGVGTCGNTVPFTQSGATGMTISPTGGDLSGGSGTAGVGGAQLVVLQWAAGGTLTSPTALNSNSSYPNCTAPCMISVPFHGTPTDTYSAPFVHYGEGGGPATIYVGDDTGVLHQFQNIFLPNNGTNPAPSEVTTGGWPVTVNSNASLGSPVYDTVSENVFVGDYPLGFESTCYLSPESSPCGYLYSVNSSGTVAKSAQLDYNEGIYDSPLLDSTAEELYAFVGDDNSTDCSSGPCAGVFQFQATFQGGASGTEAQVGAGYEFMMSGAFDNQYLSNSTPTGNLYVVGGTGAQNNTLYAIPISSGTMSTPVAGPAIATNYTNGYYSSGLQVTEFYNSSVPADYLFTSVLGFGSQFSGNNPCPNQSVTIGCIMGFTAPSTGQLASSAYPNGVLQEEGGTSGIVVDNGTAGASNIYFSTLLNQSCTTSSVTNGCAVQTTQSAP
jgi:hypothetical protein